MRSVRCTVALALIYTGFALPQTRPGADQSGYTDRYILVNGLRLHYLDWGSETRPPFIMLHGISRVAHQFDHIAPNFTENYHVMAIDMRGHGDSAWSPEGAYVVEDYVKDLEAFVAQLDLRGLTLLGNSTGGRVVQVYAGLHPERVAHDCRRCRPGAHQ